MGAGVGVGVKVRRGRVTRGEKYGASVRLRSPKNVKKKEKHYLGVLGADCGEALKQRLDG